MAFTHFRIGVTPQDTLPPPATMAYNHIRFGIESEVLLTTSSGNTQDHHTVAELVRQYYENHKKKSWCNMENKVNSVHVNHDTTKWTLARNATINDGNGKFGIEVISPILHFNNPDFRNMVRGVWHSLRFFCSIVPEESCSTQVHVSPDTGYNIIQLKAIARAILYFEPAINALIPSHRRGNTWCKSFYASHPEFKDTEDDPKLAIAKVDDAEEENDIVELMNPDGRAYAWNFESLRRYGSLEFRQGPGVSTADETLGWAEFVVTFINATLRKLPASYQDFYPAFPPNVGGLKMFLQAGTYDGVSKESILKQITGRAKNSAAIPGEAPP